MSKYKSSSSFLVFPGDLNHGATKSTDISKATLFGGKMLSENDCEASKVARNIIWDTEADTAVTASMGKTDFLHPAKLGDLVIMEADVISFGRSSMVINVSSYIKIGADKANWIKMCDAVLTFVALKDGVPYPHGHFTSELQEK